MSTHAVSKHCIRPKRTSWVLTNQTVRLQTYVTGLFVSDLGIDIYSKGVCGSDIEIAMLYRLQTIPA